jgi:hypothetical protein
MLFDVCIPDANLQNDLIVRQVTPRSGQRLFEDEEESFRYQEAIDDHAEEIIELRGLSHMRTG